MPKAFCANLWTYLTETTMNCMLSNNNSCSTNQNQCHDGVVCSEMPILSLSDNGLLHILDIQTYMCDVFLLRHVRFPYAYSGLCFMWTVVDRRYIEISLSLHTGLRSQQNFIKNHCHYSWIIITMKFKYIVLSNPLIHGCNSLCILQ